MGGGEGGELQEIDRIMKSMKKRQATGGKERWLEGGGGGTVLLSVWQQGPLAFVEVSAFTASLLKHKQQQQQEQQPQQPNSSACNGSRIPSLNLFFFNPCSYIPTSLIPRRPSQPPRAIGAVIPSRTAARFRPAANHFVSAQTELPDRCAQTVSVSRKRPSW